MPEPEEDEFFDTLSGCVAPLAGKFVPVQLLAEEIELIRWAIRAFENESVAGALGELIEKATGDGVKREEILRSLDWAFRDHQSKEKTIKKLLFKLNGAVEIAAQKHKDQKEMDLDKG